MYLENKRKPFFEFVKKILRIFKRKPKVINENAELDDVAIYLSNHSAASGPLVYELYFPKAMRFWGTHEMCGTLGEQWKYLRTTYYHDKKHLPRWLAVIVATIVVPFVHGFIRACKFCLHIQTVDCAQLSNRVLRCWIVADAFLYSLKIRQTVITTS